MTIFQIIIIFIKLHCILTARTKIIINDIEFIGAELETWKGNKFSAFRGIRYATPPVGDLRFKDPHPFNLSVLETKIYDAQYDGNDCPSINAVNMSEDCLFLNVYTKNLIGYHPKPVIAFIHPGGFYVGSSLSSVIGPEYLMEQDIVLVTFNYRLGTFGFLNLGVPQYPGNSGLKDQVYALRWIKDNIGHFGGNPDDVTLMGYSAGGFSVQLHMVSPMSKGLFHNAISMSGSIPPQFVFPRHHQINIAQRQLYALNCTFDNKLATVLECLNSKNGLEIASTTRELFDFGKDNPIYLWLPVIEKDFGQERFLIENPYKSLKDANFNKVPVLAGFTDREFCTSAREIVESEELLNNFNQNFDKLAPICFMYDQNSHKENITKEIRRIYFEDDIISKEHYKNLCNLFSDSIIRYGTYKFSNIINEHVHVYQYVFSYSGKYRNFRNSDLTAHKGAEHMDDLMYLFKMNPLHISPFDAEAEIVEFMTSFFSQFGSEKWFNQYNHTLINVKQYFRVFNNITKNTEALGTLNYLSNFFPIN